MDKALFKAKRISRQTAGHLRSAISDAKPEKVVKLSRRDKRFFRVFLIVAAIVTLLYWSIGGRNLFIFPAMLCIAAVIRKYHWQRAK